MPEPDGLIARIEREAGVPDLVDVLASRLAPTDLQSLLIAVHARRAAAVTPSRLLEQYATNRFVRPSPVDPRAVLEVERVAWSLLPAGYAPIELSPLCPLGTNSAVATVSQNKVVATDRNTEVVADCTNVLALEAALRRRAARIATRGTAPRRHDPVLLATSQRLTRLLRGRVLQALRDRGRRRRDRARRRRPGVLDAPAARRREGALRHQRAGCGAALRGVGRRGGSRRGRARAKIRGVATGVHRATTPKELR